ncbi:MAG: phage virion morphogenesis protein [Sphingomonadales bacterium]|nr:phage virion morphogenesis protein [Sphingomonadales bacterium]
MLKTEFKADKAMEAIRRAAERLEDMTPLFEEVQEYMVAQTRQRFIDGKSPQGVAWAAKTANTLARYKARGYGNLTRPLIGPGKRLSREIIGQATRSGAVIGSALIYSRVMQEGAEAGQFGSTRTGRPLPFGRIPARPWLGISPADETALVEMAEEYAGKPLAGDG